MRYTMLLVILAGSVLVAQATEVYRYVDDAGRVVFSDQAVQGAQKIQVEPAPATSVAPPLISETPRPSSAQQAASDSSFRGYASMNIARPMEGEALFDGAGRVDISVNLAPGLHADLGHEMEVLLDGQSVSRGGSTQLTLENIERGEHVLIVQVTDATGQVLIQSSPVRFSLRRPSLLFPGRQPNQVPAPLPQSR